MLIKPEGYACSFMEIKEDVPVCILHNTEVKPAQCRAYPGGRMEDSTGEIKTIAMKPETTLCPKKLSKKVKLWKKLLKKYL
ncbi:hypothetical protein [Persephonella sp. KM09-Lau-8]|uniref:hypothetical protein n=1 Tax=Persephonella sp. KM09-Lau-8 TaxID=1158345 RepID=UPI0018CC3AC4|nr:hypothetical protein [Persephonella sp. KM09-Lau-8]